MDTTGSGSQYVPSAATEANASAISSGVVSATPSVNAPQVRALAGEACSRSMPVRQCRPSRSAIRTTASAPTRCSSCTKYVFTDLPKPVHMLCRPVIEALAFCGHQCWLPHDDGSLRLVR